MYIYIYIYIYIHIEFHTGGSAVGVGVEIVVLSNILQALLADLAEVITILRGSRNNLRD